jgi:hypothetical protein
MRKCKNRGKKMEGKRWKSWSDPVCLIFPLFAVGPLTAAEKYIIKSRLGEEYWRAMVCKYVNLSHTFIALSFCGGKIRCQPSENLASVKHLYPQLNNEDPN